MSGNLEAQYLAVRGQDPEEAAYQQSLAKAREEDSHEGILASLGHTVGEAASSLRDPERTGKNALVALFDMVKNTAQMGADVWGAATNLDNKRTAKDMGVQNEVKPVPEIRLEDLAPDFMQQANALRDEAAFGSTGGDVFTQKSLQFAIPFMGSMKLLGAGAEVGAMANLGKAVVADAAVSFSVWDPHEGRFADLLNTVAPDLPVMGAAIDYLASNPDDSDMEARFKNVLDSQLASAAFGGFVFTAGKTLKGLKSGELLGQLTAQGPVGRSAQRGAIGTDVGRTGSYASAPDSLMGFRKSGPNKPYSESKYKKEITVQVDFGNGDSFVDGMNGLNTPHALERAHRNWEGAKVTMLSDTPYDPAKYEAAK